MWSWVWAWLGAALALGYALLAWRYSYWRRRGVPAHRPRPLVGSFLDAVLLRKTVGEVYQDIYRQFADQPVCGFFKCLQPALMVRDPALVGTVLVSEFSSFKDNDIHVSTDVDPMFGRSPFSEKGDKWKQVRTQLTSTFTPARMRGLRRPLQQMAQEISDFLKSSPDRESNYGQRWHGASVAMRFPNLLAYHEKERVEWFSRRLLNQKQLDIFISSRPNSCEVSVQCQKFIILFMLKNTFFTIFPYISPQTYHPRVNSRSRE